MSEEIVAGKAQERPLVTFALFAYNQEKYIREAVEGAFAQTYEPLEIILSDDCSTDRTFEIMQEMAKKYNGKNRIILNKNHINKGLIEHVNELVFKANGEIIVIASGDDVSMPERSSKILKAYLENNRPMLIHSKAKVIDKNGNFSGGEIPTKELRSEINPVKACISLALYVGATGAWSSDLIKKYGKIIKKNTYEDLIMGFRASLENSTYFIDESLVNYRIHHNSISNTNQNSFLKSRKKHIKIALDTLLQRKNDLKVCNNSITENILNLIENELNLIKLKNNLYSSPFYILVSTFTNPRATLLSIYQELSIFLRTLR